MWVLFLVLAILGNGSATESCQSRLLESYQELQALRSQVQQLRRHNELLQNQMGNPIATNGASASFTPGDSDFRQVAGVFAGAKRSLENSASATTPFATKPKDSRTLRQRSSNSPTSIKGSSSPTTTATKGSSSPTTATKGSSSPTTATKGSGSPTATVGAPTPSNVCPDQFLSMSPIPHCQKAQDAYFLNQQIAFGNDLNAPLLETVDNELKVEGATNLKHLQLPALNTAKDITIKNNNELLDIGLGGLMNCKGTLEIKGNGKLPRLELAALMAIGSLVISDNNQLTDIDLNSINSTGTGLLNIQISNNPNLQSLILNNLTKVNQLKISHGTLLRIEFLKLTTVDILDIRDVLQTTFLSFPKLTSISGRAFLSVFACLPGPKLFDFPKLNNTGDLKIKLVNKTVNDPACSSTSELNFPDLQTAGSIDIEVTGKDKVAEITFPALITAQDIFVKGSGQQGPVMALTVSFPELKTAWNVKFSFLKRMNRLDAPKLFHLNGSLTFSNLESMDMLNLRALEHIQGLVIEHCEILNTFRAPNLIHNPFINFTQVPKLEFIDLIKMNHLSPAKEDFSGAHPTCRNISWKYECNIVRITSINPKDDDCDQGTIIAKNSRGDNVSSVANCQTTGKRKDGRGPAHIIINGQNFRTDNSLDVFVGTQRCVVRTANKTEITCVIPEYEGANLDLFVTDAATYPVPGVFSYASPTITEISGHGCVMSSDLTRVLNCNRTQGEIVIKGKNFGRKEFPAKVLINGAPCTNVNQLNHSQLSCTLDKALGMNQPLSLLLIPGSQAKSFSNPLTLVHQPCPEGQEPDKVNEEKCVDCATGRYRSLQMRSCDDCNGETANGGTVCNVCPQFSSRSTTTGKCLCDVNYFDPAQNASSILKLCQPCPTGFTCGRKGTTLSSLVPVAGMYARANGTSAYSCPYASACTVSGCKIGYSGALCANCDVGYGRQFGFECVKCPSITQLMFQFLGVALLGVGIIFLLVSVNLKRTLAKNQESENRLDNNFQSVALKILINGLQLNGMIALIDFKWPASISLLCKLSSGLSMTSGAMNLSCIFPNGPTFFITSAVVAAFPLLSIGICALVYKMLKCCRPDKYRIEHLYLASIISVMILMDGAISKTFSLFTCRTVDDIPYLLGDVDYVCWSSSHIQWVVFIALPSLAFNAVAVPTWVVVFTSYEARKEA
eukprot:CAMPEP_0175128664 /NCGR_PEP_ID=MMETSP0087-20121206/5054_1 /TAXON_ID=136419 /ORGANISM="Unknown Unknown, Strain D1" /LENGTH=1183 /DNA_ID=CAMNT_0016410751 /DNA_START=110 /DNA_END=3661 /DNA_ORIENTATION=+